MAPWCWRLARDEQAAPDQWADAAEHDAKLVHHGLGVRGRLRHLAIMAPVATSPVVPLPWFCSLSYDISGTAAEPSNDCTAWTYRGAKWAEVIGVDPDPVSADLLKRWTVDYWDALHPYSAGGAYVNFMMDEGQERVRATYRGNYQRLAATKKKYDPDHFFHVNQNIKPAE